MKKNGAETGEKKPISVDAFVESSVPPGLRPVVAMLRRLMRETAPGVNEQISYGLPMYKARRIFAYISPAKQDITFGFSRGAELKDKYGLLKGRGKASRHLKIKDLQSVSRDALRYYIRQALELDGK